MLLQQASTKGHTLTKVRLAAANIESLLTGGRTLDALQQSLDECRTILKRLYLTRDPQSLLNLSRQELILLLDRGSGTIF